MILIHHQQIGGITGEEPLLLCLKGGDDNGGAEVLRQVSGCDSHVPPPSSPLRHFVIGEGAGRDGVDRPPLGAAVMTPTLKNECFSRARRGAHNDIMSLAKVLDRVVLPEIGDQELIERLMVFEWIGDACHRFGEMRRESV